MTKPVIFGLTAEFLAREGLGDSIAEWEDGQRAETGPGSFEWWYFDTHFDYHIADHYPSRWQKDRPVSRFFSGTVSGSQRNL